MSPEKDTNESRKRGPLQWEQSYRILEIIQRNPTVTAQELQLESATLGIEISLRTSFRFLERYRLSKGDIFKSSRSHLQVVANILMNAAPGNHLSPVDIKEQAARLEIHLHPSTIYRILGKLVATGTVVQLDTGSRTLYEWKRQRSPHGHITCVTCGRIIEFHKDYLDGLARSICEAFDCEFQRFDFTLHARCRHCRF